MAPGSTRREFLLAAGGVGVAMASPGTAAAQRAEGAWSMFCADRENSGYTTDAAPESDVGTRWAFDEPGAHVGTSPAVVDSIAYVGSLDGTLYAVDTADGSLEWTFGTAAGIRSSPAVVDGTLYVGSDDGSLYAIEAATGSSLWEFETNGDVVGSPTVADGVVFVSSTDNTIYAVEAEDGSERWSFPTAASVRSSPAIAGPDTTALTDRTLVVGSDDGIVYGIDPDTGDDRWRFETDRQIRSAPAVSDTTAFVGTLGGTVAAIDVGSGEADWEATLAGPVVASPAVAHETVYVPTRAGAVRAFETATGAEAWSIEAEMPSEPLTVTDDLLVVSDRRSVDAYEVESGEHRWSLEAFEPGPPVAVDGELYVASGTRADAALYAVGEGYDGALVAGPGAPIEEEHDEGLLSRLRFLLWPAAALGGVAMLVGLLYAAKTSGLLDWVETTLDDIGPPPTDETETETAEEQPGTAATPAPVWDAVVEDVIARATETDRTAVQNLLVTKYVDADTLDAPVVAYEIESLRDEPARVVIEEPTEPDADESARPTGEHWTLAESTLEFDREIAPGETVQTLVGRPDWPADRLEELLDSPSISVQAAVGDGSAET